MSKDFLIVAAALVLGGGGYYAANAWYVVAVDASSGCGGTCDPSASPPVTQPTLAAAESLAPLSVRLGEGNLLTGVPGDGRLSVEEVRAWLADPDVHRPLAIELPVGLDEGAADVRLPADNPLTRAKIELGRQLFFDPRLSGDRTVSCATCHDPDHGYAQPTALAEGIGGAAGRRNTPTAANRLLSSTQFHDGRAASLEEQALGPIASDAEMGGSHAAVVDLIRRVEGYRLQFERVFGRDSPAFAQVRLTSEPYDAGPMTIENVGRAIAAFERALVSGPTPWDHDRRLRRFEAAYADDLADPEWLANEEPELAAEHAELVRQAKAAPLDEAARRGAELFFGDRTGCALCHAGASFSDGEYHNLGVGYLGDGAFDDLGRFEVTGADEDRGAFKTPTLRNIA
ncbi:MAG: cytochrome-c peroxidase, partial [Planctomycetota bacterium]